MLRQIPPLIADNISSTIVENLSLFIPELIIIFAIVFSIIMDLIPKTKCCVKYFATISLFFALLYELITFGQSNGFIFYEMLKIDTFADLFKIAIIFSTAIIILISKYNSEIDKEYKSEYYVLLLSMCLGMVLLVSSTNLIMIYLSMELIGIPSYILAGMNKKDKLSNEASLKYIIYGSFASGVMLFGLSWFYGLTGQAFLSDISLIPSSPAIFISLIFILVGMAYKVSMAPFHYWTPDVYEGSPTPVTAFFSVAPKLAGLGLLIRFTDTVFINHSIASDFNWPLIISILSGITMTVGNILAIQQSNIKRMLAYSSISHIGFIMMSLSVYTLNNDLSAILLYSFVYMFMNLGAFSMVIYAENSLGYKVFDDWDGFGLKMPFWGAMMSINMIALTGLPPTSGFIAKFYIFSDLIGSKEFFWLAIIGGINAVISLYYYFRLLKHMYLLKGSDKKIKPPSLLIGFFIVFLSIQTFLFYFYWNSISGLFKGVIL